jgi:hypothetical protein
MNPPPVKITVNNSAGQGGDKQNNAKNVFNRNNNPSMTNPTVSMSQKNVITTGTFLRQTTHKKEKKIIQGFA